MRLFYHELAAHPMTIPYTRNNLDWFRVFYQNKRKERSINRLAP